MDASLYVAKTGLNAQQTRMTVIANNLANVNTIGYKKDRAVFEDLLYLNITQAGGQTGADTVAPTGFMLGTGTRVVASEKIQAQGNMISTENALDIAIEGQGHFQILQADGNFAYTRDGGFMLSEEGERVPELFVEDGLHINAKGYEIWTKLVRENLKQRFNL